MNSLLNSPSAEKMEFFGIYQYRNTHELIMNRNDHTFFTPIVIECVVAQSAPSFLPLCAKEAVICQKAQVYGL